MAGMAPERGLVAFAFVSSVDPGLSGHALVRLAGQCWAFNLRHGLTGLMRLEAGRIEQVVEGRASVLVPLAARILADPRHGVISIRSFGGAGIRRHSAWRCLGFEALGVYGGDLPPACRRPEQALPSVRAMALRSG